MDRHDAAVAAEFVGAGTVIPMHYDTFPADRDRRRRRSRPRSSRRPPRRSSCCPRGVALGCRARPERRAIATTRSRVESSGPRCRRPRQAAAAAGIRRRGRRLGGRRSAFGRRRAFGRERVPPTVTTTVSLPAGAPDAALRWRPSSAGAGCRSRSPRRRRGRAVGPRRRRPRLGGSVARCPLRPGGAVRPARGLRAVAGVGGGRRGSAGAGPWAQRTRLGRVTAGIGRRAWCSGRRVDLLL